MSPFSVRGVFLTAAHALVGWGFCGATMGAGLVLTTVSRALLIHALAVPVIFVGVSLVYFRCSAAWPPLAAAVAFLGVVIGMDFFVVALLIEKSSQMFTSVVGTWLPFALAFVSTWCTGMAVRRARRRPAAR